MRAKVKASASLAHVAGAYAAASSEANRLLFGMRPPAIFSCVFGSWLHWNLGPESSLRTVAASGV